MERYIKCKSDNLCAVIFTLYLSIRFEQFLYIVTENIIISKLTEDDADSLLEIYSSETVYHYTSDFMFTKNKKTVINNINQLGGRDFEKERYF